MELTLAGLEPAIFGSSQAAALAELGRSHVRIQRLIHLATGSSATLVRKNNGTLTDLGSGCMGSENEGREIRTPNLLIWSQTRYRCAIAPMFCYGLSTPGTDRVCAIHDRLLCNNFRLVDRLYFRDRRMHQLRISLSW